MLVAVGAVLVAFGLLATHFNRQLFDGPTFAHSVDEIRRDGDVADLVGREISAQLISANPDLGALRPLVDTVAVRVAGGDLLSGPTQRAARAAHSALVDRDRDSIVLRIADVGAVVTAVLASVAPERAPVSSNVSVTLAEFGEGELSEAVVSVAQAIDVLAWALPLASFVCFGGAVVLAHRRWRTAGSVGRGLLWAAAAVGMLLLVGGYVVRRLGTDTMGGAVTRAAWAAGVRPLWWSVMLVAAIGLAVVLACDSSAPSAITERAARVRAMVTRRPRTAFGIVVRIAASAAIGVLAIIDPLGLLEPLIVLAGIGLVLFAITELARLASAARADAPADTARPESEPRRWVPLPLAIGVLGLAGAVSLASVVYQARPGDDVVVADSADVVTCNGHEALCDRAFDEVAYVASHNAMAVLNEPGWFIAEQTDPIPRQLDQGVRALLVDVWSGRAAGTVVRTAAGSFDEALEIARAELGPEVVAAALRVANSVAGRAHGPERRYMCHGLCETGSTPFVESLEQVRGWLVGNPGEVVTLFIEDHVDAALIADDITAAGLLPFVATPPVVGEPWPTLREMIASDRRLVVMLEAGNGGTQNPWLVNGFEHTQDTAYTFPTVDDFSCTANRGPDDAPLFLLNHWLSGFSSLVSNAELVNDRNVLLERAERCRAERGQIPNFVAVNFVDRGDVYDVVDALNGLG